MKQLKHLKDLNEVKIEKDREFFSATHEEIKKMHGLRMCIF